MKYYFRNFMGARIIFAAFLIIFAVAVTAVSQAGEGTQTTVVSIGLGPQPSKTSPEGATPVFTAVDDAERKAVLSYIVKTLGEAEYARIRDAVDTLVLPAYKKYVAKTEIISTEKLPSDDFILVVAKITIDPSLPAYLANIAKLTAKSEPVRTLSTGERDILVSKAQAIFIQGEVASDILLDRLRGIESYGSAETIFETAGYDEGVYRCTMGLFRARISLGDAEGARSELSRAEKLSQTLGKPEYATETTLAWARLLFVTGDVKGAKRKLDAARTGCPATADAGLIGDIGLFSAEVDRALGDDAAAYSEALSAVSAFEKAADAKRLGRTYLMLGIIHLDKGDTAAAVTALKVAVSLAERIEDSATKAVSLVGIAEAYRRGGDPRTANPYLDDARLVVRDLGWSVGEALVNCESARLSLSRGDAAGAASTAKAAFDIALKMGLPVLAADALSVEADALLAAGKKDEAFEAYCSFVRIATDVRVTFVDLPLISVGDDRVDESLEKLLALAVDLKEEQTALTLLLGAEGNRIKKDLIETPRRLPAREDGLMSEYRAVTGAAIAAEFAAISGEFPSLAETSRAEIQARVSRTDTALIDAKKRIGDESDNLSTLMGITPPGSSRLTRMLNTDAAFVHYWAAEDNAYGIVVTRRGVTITRLGATRKDIESASRDLIAALAVPSIPSDGPVEGPEMETVLLFAAASDRLYQLVISPLLPALSGVATIGFGLGSGIVSIPINALGHAGDNGKFTFLSDDHALFLTSCLSPRAGNVLAVPVVMEGLVFMGRPDAAYEGLNGLFSRTRVVMDAGSPNEGDDDPKSPMLLVITKPGDFKWWEINAPLIVLPAGGEMPDGFFEREYYSCLKDAAFLVIPEGTASGDAAAFLIRMMETSKGSVTLAGYVDTIRNVTADIRSGGGAGRLSPMIMTDFMSEQR